MVPSPGGLYPLVLHVLTREGIHRYLPEEHRLEQVADEDRRPSLAHACLGQQFLGDAPVVLALANRRRLSRGKYGARAERYAMLEAGHAAQNVLLEAVALWAGGRAGRRVLSWGHAIRSLPSAAVSGCKSTGPDPGFLPITPPMPGPRVQVRNGTLESWENPEVF